jgi:hypothetical protein
MKNANRILFGWHFVFYTNERAKQSNQVSLKW